MTLARNEHLEAHVGEDPEDPARWAVLEDWILEQADARAEMILHEKAKELEPALLVRTELLGLLYGQAFAVRKKLIAQEWRAGFARELSIEGATPEDAALVARAPAFGLVTKLWVSLRSATDAPALLAALADSPLATSVRILSLLAPREDAGTLDGRLVAPFANLDRLAVVRQNLQYATNLDRVRRLDLYPLAEEGLRGLLAPGRLHGLRSLVIGCDSARERASVVLAPLIDRTCAPNLEDLYWQGLTTTMRANLGQTPFEIT